MRRPPNAASETCLHAPPGTSTRWTTTGSVSRENPSTSSRSASVSRLSRRSASATSSLHLRWLTKRRPWRLSCWGADVPTRAAAIAVPLHSPPPLQSSSHPRNRRNQALIEAIYAGFTIWHRPCSLGVPERQFPRPAAKVAGLTCKFTLPVHPGEPLKKRLPPTSFPHQISNRRFLK